MNVFNPWQSYRQVSFGTAPPGRLVLMLYEGALKFLQRALDAFDCVDPLEFNRSVHNNLVRTQDILHELNVTLDMEKGGDLALTLRNLYDYLSNRLHESNARKEKEGIDECFERLTVLRDAWAQMLDNQTGIAIVPEIELQERTA